MNPDDIIDRIVASVHGGFVVHYCSGRSAGPYSDLHSVCIAHEKNRCRPNQQPSAGYR
jgi:hypothetical protein